jgi:hypothetical protein
VSQRNKTLRKAKAALRRLSKFEALEREVRTLRAEFDASLLGAVGQMLRRALEAKLAHGLVGMPMSAARVGAALGKKHRIADILASAGGPAVDELENSREADAALGGVLLGGKLEPATSAAELVSKTPQSDGITITATDEGVEVEFRPPLELEIPPARAVVKIPPAPRRPPVKLPKRA